MDEALLIARQIAEAIEYAHEKGITHRDLKPANIKVTSDGCVKVLDFGLAKVLQGDSNSDSSSSSTFTGLNTEPGMIVGTAPYMSPEQAKGKPVDKRTDIWAFGVVFYEMLTGRRLFQGETLSDTLAAVLKEEPDWNQVPARVQPLLRRCLEKAPNDGSVTLEIWSCCWNLLPKQFPRKALGSSGALLRCASCCWQGSASLCYAAHAFRMVTLFGFLCCRRSPLPLFPTILRSRRMVASSLS